VCTTRGLKCDYNLQLDKRRSVRMRLSKAILSLTKGTRTTSKLRSKRISNSAYSVSPTTSTISSRRPGPQDSEQSTTKAFSVLLADATANEVISMYHPSAQPSPDSTRSNQRQSKMAPGSLTFGLKLGENGELEYRGPTSSVIGDRLPEIPGRNVAFNFSSPSNIELPDETEMRQHLDLFVEWQNSSILVLPGDIVDELLESYPPTYENLRARVVLWSILSLTYKMYRISLINFETRMNLSEAAFQEAVKLVTTLAVRRPSVEVVQAACILACRDYSCGHENGAWVFHGM
jgi:hypothetical protein